MDCLSQLVPDIMRELGVRFDETLSHFVPSCSLMNEWRWQEVEETEGGPIFWLRCLLTFVFSLVLSDFLHPFPLLTSSAHEYTHSSAAVLQT